MRPPEILHQSDYALIVWGDARQWLASQPTKTVDLVIADPPYGVDYRSNRRATRFNKMAGDLTVDDARALVDEVTPDLVRVTRGRRHIYTFGLPLIHPLLPDKAKANLIWDKGRIGSGNLASPWGPGHEPIFFHVRAPDSTNARDGAGGLSARLRRGSIIRVDRLSATQVKRHPTEKPVALIRQLIEASSSLGDVVLDPFAGSGSTGVAAILEGRTCILVEDDVVYATDMVERIRAVEKHAAQACSL